MFDFDEFLKQIGVRPRTEAERLEARYQLLRSEAQDLLGVLQRLPETERDVAAAAPYFRAAAGEAEADLARAVRTLEGLVEALQRAKAEAEDRDDERRARENAERQRTMLDSASSAPLVYELGLMADAVEQLTGLPGAESDLQTLRDMARTAEACLDTGDHDEGVRALRDRQRVLDRGLSHHEARLRDARAKFGTAFEKLDAIRSLVDARIVKDVRDQIEARLMEIVRPLHGAEAGERELARALEELESVESDVRLAGRQAAQGEAVALAQLRECEQALEAAQSNLEEGDRAQLARRVALMRGEIEQGLFWSADTAGQEIVDELERLVAAHRALVQQWERERPEIDQLRTQCERWGSDAFVHELSPNAELLSARLTTLAETDVGRAMPVAEALQRLAAARSSIQAIEVAIGKRTSLADVIARYDRELDSVNTAFEAALAAIRVPPHFPEDGGDGISVFRREMATATAVWEQRKKSAVDEAQLDGDLAVAVAREILGRAEAPPSYLKLAARDLLRQKQREFDELKQVVQRELEPLKKFGTEDYARLEGELQRQARGCEAEEHAEMVTRFRIPALGGIRSDAVVALGRLDEQRRALHAECAELDRIIEGRLDAFDQTLAEYSTSFLTSNPQYEEYAQTLRNRLVQNRQLWDEFDIDILSEAKEFLLGLRSQVDVARRGLREGSAGDKTLPVLENVTRLIAQITSSLNDSALKTYRATTHGSLSGQLKAIDKAKTRRPFDESMQALQKLARGVRRELVVAAQDKAAYVAFQKDVKAARKRVQQTSQLFDHDAYREELEERLRRYEKNGKSEGQLAEARRELAELLSELDDIVSDPQILQANAGAADAVAESKKRAKAEFEQLYDQHWQGQLLPRVREALAEGGESSKYDELVKMGKQARQTLKKTDDAELAMTQLRVAIDRANDIIEHPGGPALHARNQLPTIEREWRTAVAGFRDALGQIASEVASADPGAASAIRSATDAVGNLFLERAFERFIAVMTDPTKSAADIRRAREGGLVIVRRYRGYLQADRRFFELNKNPFVAPFRLNARLNTALFNLERNLLISV